jgi:hypothetical protein
VHACVHRDAPAKVVIEGLFSATSRRMVAEELGQVLPRKCRGLNSYPSCPSRTDITFARLDSHVRNPLLGQALESGHGLQAYLHRQQCLSSVLCGCQFGDRMVAAACADADLPELEACHKVIVTRQVLLISCLYVSASTPSIPAWFACFGRTWQGKQKKRSSWHLSWFLLAKDLLFSPAHHVHVRASAIQTKPWSMARKKPTTGTQPWWRGKTPQPGLSPGGYEPDLAPSHREPKNNWHAIMAMPRASLGRGTHGWPAAPHAVCSLTVLAPLSSRTRSVPKKGAQEPAPLSSPVSSW